MITALLHAAVVWATVETVELDWNDDGKRDRIVLSIPKPWNDPGEFTRVTVELAGKPPQTIDAEGVHRTGFHIDSVVSSHYVALLPSETAGHPLLVFVEYAYASGPGHLRIFALGKDDRVTSLYDKGFYPASFSSYKDRTMFTGRQFGAECIDSQRCQYDPEVVMLLKRDEDGTLRFEMSLEESAKLNADRNYPWAGPEFLKDKLVLTPKRVLIDRPK